MSMNIAAMRKMLWQIARALPKAKKLKESQRHEFAALMNDVVSTMGWDTVLKVGKEAKEFTLIARVKEQEDKA